MNYLRELAIVNKNILHKKRLPELDSLYFHYYFKPYLPPVGVLVPPVFVGVLLFVLVPWFGFVFEPAVPVGLGLLFCGVLPVGYLLFG